MHDKQYKAPPEKLRSQDRIRLLEIERVVGLCLADGKIATVLDVGCGTGLFSEAFALPWNFDCPFRLYRNGSPKLDSETGIIHD